MKAFTVRWRSARQFREYEMLADEVVGACIVAALEISEGSAVWQAGTLWKCPGCRDRTVRTEEFLEGLRRAEICLQGEAEWGRLSGVPQSQARRATLEWLARAAAKMLGCERDRVYIKDEDTLCSFSNETYVSRV